jgi:Spy/CpxP family protein refolding chaperone
MNYLKFFSLIIIITSFLTTLSFTQPPAERGPRPERGARIFDRLPDLTEEQQEQIKQLRTAHLKEILPIENKIREKAAQLNTLETSEKVDMVKINKTIEELGELKVTIAKKRAAHRQDIRKILTEDQRVIFDSMPGKRGPHFDNEGGRGYQRDDRPGKRF